MRLRISKWGNSAAVRIPSSILQSSGLTLDSTVDVRDDDGRVVIEPVERTGYSLDSLLAGITTENRHEEVDTGSATGQEAL